MQSEGARLWLVRHGETDWNVERRVQGHTPTSLNANGRKQARELAEFFADRKFAAVYASDLPRAFETAEIIVAKRKQPVTYDPRLRERCLGKYQGMLSKDLHAMKTARGLTQVGDLADWRGFEGVESNADLWGRASAALKEISDKYHGKDVLVVSHGGVLSQAVCESLGIPNTSPRRFPLSNGMIAVLQWRVDAFYMLSLLDVGLLLGGKASVDTSKAAGGN